MANMFIDLDMCVALTDQQFEAEIARRREKMRLTQTDVLIGCPLCNVTGRPRTAAATSQQQR